MKAKVLVFAMNRQIVNTLKVTFDYHGSTFDCDYFSFKDDDESSLDLRSYDYVVILDYIDPERYDCAYSYIGIHALKIVSNKGYRGGLIVSLVGATFNALYVSLSDASESEVFDKKIDIKKFLYFAECYFISDFCMYNLPLVIHNLLSKKELAPR